MLKLINPDTSPESQELYLYWIRSESMKDMSSEGYIGVTTNVKNRFGANVTRFFKKFGLKSKVDLRSRKEVLC